MTNPYAPDLGNDCNVADLFGLPSSADARKTSRTRTVKRLTLHTAADRETKLDIFSNNTSSCAFVRFTPGRDRDIGFVLKGAYRVTPCASGGWMLLPTRDGDDLDSYWLPQAPRLRRLDKRGHVLEERDVQFSGITLSPFELALQIRILADQAMDWTIWRLPSTARNVLGELRDLLPFETQAHFLWGSHTRYQRPADVYLHLIHGHVYETRFSWPKRWKIHSENDAHALHTVLGGLESATGKELYHLLKAQLLLSVLDRQSEDGGWRHGEWTDRMESHYRLHCSAMHMLMDALAENEDPAVRAALERAAAFLARQTDKLDAGVWFLHDELEHSSETLCEGPFRSLPSRVLGKSESNMLVLNSHLDATVALDRYREVTDDTRHQALVAQAVSTTRSVLSLRPAEWLYRPLFRAIRLTFLPSARAARLPLHRRALKRLAWKYLIPLLPYIKARWPRMVMPGGYIDRELSLRVFAHEYLPVNLMDLLRYRRRFPAESVDDTIFAATALVRDCRMFERWLEIKGKEYAVGFWAEALYQICLIRPEVEYRALLAQAVVTLESRGLGLPSSLLGANSEAVAPRDQVPAPLPDDARIRVVNLSRSGAIEVLLINCSNDLVHPRIVRNAPTGMAWSVGADTDRTDHLPQEIPARGWLWGRSLK